MFACYQRAQRSAIWLVVINKRPPIDGRDMASTAGIFWLEAIDTVLTRSPMPG